MAAMKAKKAMKAMKARRAMKKVSARLAKRHVFAGKAAETGSGLSKDDLIKNQAGKIVSKKKFGLGRLSVWMDAVATARKILGVEGFQAIKKGTPLYNKAKELLPACQLPRTLYNQLGLKRP